MQLVLNLGQSVCNYLVCMLSVGVIRPPIFTAKTRALNTLLSGNFPGLANVVGDIGISSADLMQAVNPFVTALYNQVPGTSMEVARFNLFTKKKSPKVMALPLTSANLLQHALRAHLQIMLWKAADQQAPPAVSATITDFGWEVRNGIPVPVMASSDPAPPELVDVIRCLCRAEGKKCSTVSCSCHREHLTCTSYCNCRGEDGCYNPYTQKTATTQAADLEMEEAEEQEVEEQDFEGVSDAEEQSEEDEEYDTETEFMTE